MSLKLQFLGTGTSVGVPQIGCTCPTCTSADPRDKRRRSGLYVTSDKTHFIVDTPPEFRVACLDLDISRVDAVVITHAHMDHIAGFDDIRRFNTLNGGAPMRCYAAPETIATLRSVFPYITEHANEQGLFRPMINFEPVEDTFEIADVRVSPLPVLHGPRTNGYLFECDGGRAAYISDCHEIPAETLDKIRGVDLLVLNCLRERFHPTHLNREASLAYVAEIKPKDAYFIHMCHDVLHAEFEKSLPENVHLAYDGLVLEVGNRCKTK